MFIEKIDNYNPDEDIIYNAVQILEQGGVLVIPTETAYGLAADANNEQAVEKIYQIKGRDFNKFLPLIANNLVQLKSFFKVSPEEEKLLDKYPGLAVVLEIKDKKSNQPSIYRLAHQQTSAIRITLNKVSSLLAERLGRPITATSANRSGGGNCYAVGEVLKQINKEEVDFILDAGKLKKRRPSTIVKIEGGRVRVLRQGEVKLLDF